MAHPDKTRGGSEKRQRQHAGQTSRHSDAGMQANSQHGHRGGEATAASGEAPSAAAPSKAKAGRSGSRGKRK